MTGDPPKTESGPSPSDPTGFVVPFLTAANTLWTAGSLPDLLRRIIELGRNSCALGPACIFSRTANPPIFRTSAIHWDPQAANQVQDILHAHIPALDGPAVGLQYIDGNSHQASLTWARFEGQPGQFLYVFWGGTPASNHGRVLLDALVRQSQAQCRWYGLLDQSQHLVYGDDVTGVYNHRYLDVALETELRRADRLGTTFSLLFIDIDTFKTINDRFGHLIGSEVLRQVAERIRRTLRDIDTIIRYGGDEFVCILVGTRTPTASITAERLRQQIAEPPIVCKDGTRLTITVSIGIASFPENGQDKESLIRIADAMMYRSKGRGRNQVTCAPSEPGAPI